MLDFTNQVVLVTGAGSAKGMGRVIAQTFGKQGAKVVICDINQAGCDANVEEMKKMGIDATGYAANLTDPEAVKDVMIFNCDNLANLIDTSCNCFCIQRFDGVHIQHSCCDSFCFQLKEGKDVAIIANGDTVRLALDAAKELEAKGITARVLDMHTIKPLDTEAVTACINEIGKVITVEDHNILNGLGSAVCEVAAEMGKGIVKRIGVQDQYGQSAPYERLLAMNGITVENIVKTAEELQ